MVKTIEWRDGKGVMLNQSRLPLEVKFIECTDCHMVADGIKKLWIKGAPAIGIAAAMGIALGAQDIKAESFDEFTKQIEPIIKMMLSTRPTAVNISWATGRIERLLLANKERPIDRLKELLIYEANKILEEDIEVNKAIGRWGSEFIKDGDTILTHCNAGSFATGGHGTATAPLLIATEQGKRIQVIAGETRSVLQGARLTSWELIQAGIPVTLITDSTVGALMKNEMIDLVIVGTDRTTKNGDVANKIGTYTIAVLCKEHNIPFYVAAPLSSIDFGMHSGDLIPIEERHPDEVTTIWGHRVVPEGVNVINLSFDVTPANYVASFFYRKRGIQTNGHKKINESGYRHRVPEIKRHMTIKDIFADYSEELRAVDEQLMDLFKSNVFLIPMIGRHILNSGGKRIRPLFLLLSAELCGYKGADRILLAATIEAIHTASLLHDDVIDDAETRRGESAAHTLWGRQAAILAGDFLYSNALMLAVSQKNQKITEAFSEAVTRMVEGEILQLCRVGDPEITKEEYFDIISAKTGVLLSAACRIGGILSNQPEKREMSLLRFGMKTGTAFQLADDILDYVAEQRELGKKLGKDLAEGKITMPLIYLLKVAADVERDEIKDIINEAAAAQKSKKRAPIKGKTQNSGLKRIIDLFSRYNAIEESLKIAEGLVVEAKSELEVFPDSRERDVLLTMAEYTMQRDK
ncbi:S-methyl-5-thioribose-1-phosphate isomerase [Thermodesulfovibrionales bacterium]|nr:S-methyl-5-thioribose-1-phosphate isomerase [Thermodesulfovibrionales bacterium]MCL0086540.1 S-methyl-5-thioribose-1-phosphate isomerase [Thermodesulfovibrionales bacterium]